MYKDTVTLFCYASSGTDVIWYPHMLENVDVNTDKGWIAKVYGTDSDDTVALHIRFTKGDDEAILIGNTKYLPPLKWASASEDEKARCITLQGGTKFGFFLIGVWEGGTEPVADDGYKQGFFSHMKSNYDGVYAISKVSGPFSVIPHFELTGK